MQPQKMAQFNLSTVCLLLLLSLSLFSMQADAACCTTYSQRKLPENLVKGFSIQDNRGQCRINAVIFLTLKGKKVCTDPTKDWVMERIKQLRNKVQEMTKSGSPKQG